MLTAMVNRRIDVKDPLYRHLATIVLPRAELEVKDPVFECSRLSARETVYLFEEKKTRVCFVGKFFGLRPQLSDHDRQNCLNQEFKNLRLARKMGLRSVPHRVVQPFSKTERLNFLLVEDYVRGHDLDYYIAKAVYNEQQDRLRQKLTLLAHFFFQLHNCITGTNQVNFGDDANYLQSIIESLARDRLLDTKTVSEISHLFNQWEKTDEMWSAKTVLVHGDTTPTNFIFHPDDGVTAIDLERMHLGDCMYDIGMLAAELKHHFAWRILKADAAEPFITHFFKTYCAQFSDPETVFKQVTLRNRFYMALGEIRIARNPWLPLQHRTWLIEEARRCLCQ
jgi:aminoglycoside phosphotransferase (APT) family kinase protein